MKKLILGFCLFSTLLRASTLDDLLALLEQNSYEQEKRAIQEKILEEKEQYLAKGDFQEGLILEASYEERQRKGQEEELLKGLELKYGPFFASVYDRKGREKQDLSLGLQKSLRDMWYSANESARLQLVLEKQRQHALESQKMQEKKIKLIRWYQDYQNAFEERKWKADILNTLEGEERKLAKAYSLGSVRRLDWESAKVNLESIRLEISILERELKQAKQVLEREFRISEKGNFEPLALLSKHSDLPLENYGRERIQEKVSQIAIQKEKIKYLGFQRKIPELNLRYEHLFASNDRRGEDVIQLQLRKKLFEDDYEEAIEAQELKVLELDLKEIQEQLALEKEGLRQKYENYQSQLRLAEGKLAFAKSKYEVKELEYRLGKSSYVDVMEALEGYTKTKLEAQRAKNQFASFLYEVQVRSHG